MKPSFIVVEGLEGAGKSTAIQFVCEWLESLKVPYIQVREPGGTPLAESIRALLKESWQEQMNPETELLLVYAARAQLVREVILPSLSQGICVVGDRHDLSTQAYQGVGRGLPESTLGFLRDLVLKDLTPDLTLYLDIQPETGLQRARTRGQLDRIEQESIDFFHRVRKGYLQIIEQDPKAFKIDAEQSIQSVESQIKLVLEQELSFYREQTAPKEG